MSQDNRRFIPKKAFKVLLKAVLENLSFKVFSVAQPLQEIRIFKSHCNHNQKLDKSAKNFIKL